ncbi:MAG: trehalose-phosphatase [Candidatus Omnitrophota bacterium]|nr:trehalose-phosphatase [Candidatus Omnitrophota bacterium]MBU1894305.1 trehalose-phosphatase [Candidatus Omnitrophota bacterium]
MKSLKKEWNNFKRKIKSKEIYLFLDLDGTLCPLRRRIDNVVLSADKRMVLEKLNSLDNVSIAIVSGRKISDLQKIVGIKNLVYVGNHGFELQGFGGQKTVTFLKKFKRYEKLMNKIKTNLEKTLEKYNGVVVEDKGITLGVHYRQITQKMLKEVKCVFENVVAPYRNNGKVLIRSGKKVWEVRPPVNWNKGRMVSWIFAQVLKKRRINAAAFCMGDDKTDEDMFKEFKGNRKVCTIKIGKKIDHSNAGYYLENTTEVADFLKKLYRFKSRKESV